MSAIPDSAIPDSAIPDNAVRYRAGRGIHESWFLRANHPSAPKALWLKLTIVGDGEREAVATVWCSLFDGDAGRTWAGKRDVPASEATLGDDTLSAAGAHFSFDPASGHCVGSVENSAGQVSWDLRWSRLDGPLGASLCLLPSRRLLKGPLPKSKFVTPAPALRFSGTLTWDGVEWSVDDWFGMQGHNWSLSAPARYAWGHCLFTDASGDPFALVEAVSGELKIAGWTTPTLSLMTVRRGGRTYRFSRMVDVWNQRAHIEYPDWTLRMKGPDGEALLSMRGRPERMVCLGYAYPGDPQLTYCLNSKLASVSLRVNPTNETSFELRSEHGGALEFLQRTEEAGVQPVV